MALPVSIYYAYTQKLSTTFSLQELLQQLPESLHADILRYRFDKDRYVHALGKYLLKEQLSFFGIGTQALELLQTNDHGKPKLPIDSFSFNISHSHELVLCGAAMGCILGIDAEYIRPTEIAAFESYFTKEEWQKVGNAHSLDTFFEVWTKKESIIKADGRGLYLPLDTINTLQNPIEIINGAKTNWFLKELVINPAYKACLCSNQANIEVGMKEII